MGTTMSIVGITLVASVLAAAPVLAGRNAGGVLMFYTNDAVVYTTDNEPYTGGSGLECPEDPSCPPYDGNNCPANQLVVASGHSSTKTNDSVVFWLLAAWPEEACPQLKGVEFGIDYDPTTLFFNSLGAEADFELTSPHQGQDWPAPRSGTALVWFHSRTSHLKEIYWFSAYVYDQPTGISIVNHPSQGIPKFGDNDLPGELDPVLGLPTLGLAGATGYNPPVEADPVGACCLPYGDCELITAALCLVQGGSFLGVDAPCDPDPCAPVPGACCLGDGACEQLVATECALEGGVFIHEGVDCVPTLCGDNSGACCLGDVCVRQFKETCYSRGGEYLGDDYPCDPNPCPVPPGACCATDGTCFVQSATSCEFGGGVYLGSGTTCEPNPCPQPDLGACCLSAAECQMLSPSDCTAHHGVYLGDETDCATENCGTQQGGCCLGGTCFTMFEGDCIRFGGEYLGDGYVCEATTCVSSPIGACCLIDGGCEIMTSTDCEQQSGTFQGENTVCGEPPCPAPVPTQRLSWGSVKARYR